MAWRAPAPCGPARAPPKGQPGQGRSRGRPTRGRGAVPSAVPAAPRWPRAWPARRPARWRRGGRMAVSRPSAPYHLAACAPASDSRRGEQTGAGRGARRGSRGWWVSSSGSVCPSRRRVRVCACTQRILRTCGRLLDRVCVRERETVCVSTYTAADVVARKGGGGSGVTSSSRCTGPAHAIWPPFAGRCSVR